MILNIEHNNIKKVISAQELDFSVLLNRYKIQHTVSSSVIFNGVGVHSGKPVCMIVHPAPIDHGIIFERTDIEDKQNRIKASWQNVKSTNMCTTIANSYSGVSVSTVEHIMAALFGLGVSNALITIDSAETPMMDGGAYKFCEGIIESGLFTQEKQKPLLHIKEPIKVSNEHGYAEFTPSDESIFKVEFIPNERFEKVAKNQFCEYIPEKDDFFNKISKARSFGFFEDAQKLWSMGLAKGSSLDNTVVIDNGSIMNKEGLFYKDEFVRHKMLDVIGDISLAEYNIIGCYNAQNPSHTLNYMLLKKYFESLN